MTMRRSSLPRGAEARRSSLLAQLMRVEVAAAAAMAAVQKWPEALVWQRQGILRTMRVVAAAVSAAAPRQNVAAL